MLSKNAVVLMLAVFMLAVLTPAVLVSAAMVASMFLCNNSRGRFVVSPAALCRGEASKHPEVRTDAGRGSSLLVRKPLVGRILTLASSSRRSPAQRANLDSKL